MCGIMGTCAVWVIKFHGLSWLRWFSKFWRGQYIFNMGEKFEVGSLEYKLLRKPQ